MSNTYADKSERSLSFFSHIIAVILNISRIMVALLLKLMPFLKALRMKTELSTIRRFKLLFQEDYDTGRDDSWIDLYTPTHCQDRKLGFLRWIHHRLLKQLERREPEGRPECQLQQTVMNPP